MEVRHLLLLRARPAPGREKELISSCGLENAALNIWIICCLHRNHCAAVIGMFGFLASKAVQPLCMSWSLCTILKRLSEQHRMLRNLLENNSEILMKSAFTGIEHSQLFSSSYKYILTQRQNILLKAKMLAVYFICFFDGKARSVL